MKVSREDVQLLATLIVEEIKTEFDYIKLSGNLADSIQIIPNGKDEFKIVIPAIKYDIGLFKKKGVIAFEPEKGSYAEKVNETGGFSGQHKNYIERSVDVAISKWESIMQGKYKIIDRRQGVWK